MPAKLQIIHSQEKVRFKLGVDMFDADLDGRQIHLARIDPVSGEYFQWRTYSNPRHIARHLLMRLAAMRYLGDQRKLTNIRK